MSLKFRLALVNTVFVLLALGLGLFLLVSQTRRVFLDSLDRDLVSRALHGPQGMRGPNGPGAPGQNRPGQNGPNQFPRNQMQGDNGNPDDPQNNPPQPNGNGPDSGPQRNDDVGRPIRYTPEGQPLNSQETRILDPAALAKKETRRPILTTVLVEGVPTRVVTAPRPGIDRIAGYVQFGHDLQDFELLKKTQTTTILFLLPISLIIAAAVGWFLAANAVQPINTVALASEKISGSDMSTRLIVKGDDEIGRLSSAFNGMVDRLQLSFNERQELLDNLNVALEKQRQFVGDASHELRTPLARIRITTSSVLEQESSPAEMKEALEIADRETVNMSNLVDQLLMLARLDSGHLPSLSNLNLSNIAKEAVDKFPHSSSNPIVLALDANAQIRGDHDGLVRAVVNLLENARRYCPDKEISVSTRTIDGRSVLCVRDHGIGIEPQHLSRLTERFFRVDDARNRKMGGTGLGLAIVKSIVESSGGNLLIKSKPGEGTEVELIFPAISGN